MNMHVGSELALELHRQAVERRKRMGAHIQPRPVVIFRPADTTYPRLYEKPIGPSRRLTPFMRHREMALEKYGITLEQFNGPKRSMKIAAARREVWYACHVYHGMNFTKIWRQSGGICRQTVGQAVKHQIAILGGQWTPRKKKNDELWRTDVERIVGQVAEKHGVEPANILAPNRRYARAAQEAMWRLRQETGMSSPQIGRFLKRDHTTILHGIKAHDARVRGEQPPKRNQMIEYYQARKARLRAALSIAAE